MSNGALNQPTSSNRPFSSVFDSFPNFSMSNLPTFRFAGDGLDYRRPTPTVPLPNNQDIIDLTEDHSPEVQRQPRPSNRTNPGNFIDIDEESTTVNVDDASLSPDLELLEVRSIRSQNTSVPDHRPRENARPRSTLRPPHIENQPFAVGGWNGLRQHAQGHRSNRNHETARRFHQLLHTNHPNPRREMLLMHQSPDIILPGDLDFVTQGFQLGDVTNRQQPPPPPTYKAPSPARQGFTRSPKEDDHLICPNCEAELGAGKDDSKRQVWVIKACGHARSTFNFVSNFLSKMSQGRPSPTPLTKGEIAKEYLTAYNAICALLWLSVFGRTVVILPITGVESVYEAAGDFTKWTQTVAILEILHSAFGLVRSPLPTTILQVASRIVLVWAVVNQFPAATSTSPFYSSMLIAWSATEVVRYSYFVLNLRGSVPAFMMWLRYNMFYVLYPVGITSEAVLVWKASEAAREPWKFVGWGVLGLYVPEKKDDEGKASGEEESSCDPVRRIKHRSVGSGQSRDFVYK
ncbi:MAG: hypothetical protein Q9192_000773 [Flavoplaca navasiana]